MMQKMRGEVEARKVLAPGSVPAPAGRAGPSRFARTLNSGTTPALLFTSAFSALRIHLNFPKPPHQKALLKFKVFQRAFSKTFSSGG